jgi:uncharacterized membrane protein YobD (UPF0266 family)
MFLQNVSLENPHCVKSQKTPFFIVTAVKPQSHIVGIYILFISTEELLFSISGCMFQHTMYHYIKLKEQKSVTIWKCYVSARKEIVITY